QSFERIHRSNLVGMGVLPLQFEEGTNAQTLGLDGTETFDVAGIEGTLLLGVKAVIAESFERIHRSNLVGMGVLPLVFQAGQNAESLGLTGRETFSIAGLAGELKPRQEVTVAVKRPDGTSSSFAAVARLDTPVEINYYRNGGILPTVLRKLIRG
ncbi:MAG TPA: hypothetical protein VFQ51_07200, partial [Vicinamibacteria bacterium]|nr:hypothetical protein [Vicinamibacteria bacterium]